MSWASWSDFFAMGGYALYVWGSYAVTAGLIALEVIMLILRRRNALNSAAGLTAGDRP
ncbi:MAG TPA: heme exporter protein CcmD [Burkholderiales bacterium]|nr:heme exporter protein CcmD [Burkholderiales bacterium]